MILLTGLIGGGAGQGLWSDHLIELAMVPALFIGFGALLGDRLSIAVKIFTFGVLAFLALQFLPFAPPRNLPVFEGLEIDQRFWTTNFSRSLEAGLICVFVLGFGLFVAAMPAQRQERVLIFVLLAMAINFLIGVIQLSYAREEALEGLLAYSIRAGVFANENHFSTMILAAIPLMAFFLLTGKKRIFTFIGLQLLVIVYLFAVGSRTGMVLSGGVAVLCLLWFGVFGSNFKINLLASIIALAALGVFSQFLSSEALLKEDLRTLFFENTLTAIGEHWLFGTGPGSFVIIYPIYHGGERILSVAVNAAHNDYLQVILEGGVFAIVLMVLYFLIFLANIFNNKMTTAAGFAIFVMLVHSLVDYPLRTLFLLTLFAVFSAIVFTRVDPIKEDWVDET